MTLAFALRGSNGLVLGADSRVSGAFGSADTSTKFLQVNREIGILTYGLAEVGYKSINSIVDQVNGYSDFSATATPRIVHFSEIIKKTQEICKKTYGEVATELKKNNSAITDRDLTTGFILAGYDANETNQFKIHHFESPKFESDERPGDIIAAQWHISQFLSNHFYYQEMDVEQLKRLASFMLIETGVISTSVGGRLKIATVTLENGFQLLNEKEIQNIICENQPRFAKYRRILLDNLRF
jgi:20S proteasome alpha/beta subunit